MKIIMSILILFFSTSLFADGCWVKRWIPLNEQIHRSPIIFVGIIIKKKHIWAERYAYGKNRKYIAKYIFIIRIAKILKINKTQHKLQPGDKITVHRFSGTIPGKWVIIEKKYKETIHPFSAKKGLRCIFYCGPIIGSKCRFSAMDKLTKIPTIKNILKNKH